MAYRDILREALITWGLGTLIGAPVAYVIAHVLGLGHDASFVLGVVCGMVAASAVWITRAMRA